MGPAASVNRDAGLSEARDKFLTTKMLEGDPLRRLLRNWILK